MIWKKPEKLKRRLLEKQYEYILSPDFTLDRLVTQMFENWNQIRSSLEQWKQVLQSDPNSIY